MGGSAPPKVPPPPAPTAPDNSEALKAAAAMKSQLRLRRGRGASTYAGDDSTAARPTLGA
jgi:hypothetical protein